MYNQGYLNKQVMVLLSSLMMEWLAGLGVTHWGKEVVGV